MPEFALVTDDVTTVEADLLVVGATRTPQDDRDATPVLTLGPGAAAVAGALDVDLAGELAAMRFDAAVGTLVRVPTRGRLAAPMLVVAGLGDDGTVTATSLRRAAAAVAGAAERSASLATSLASADGVEAEHAAQAVVEGLTLGAYRFAGFKSDARRHELATVHLVVADADAAARGVAAGAATAAAATLVRDLVNTPSGQKRPPDLADRAATEVAGLPIEVRVLDEDDLVAGGYGGLLGVAAGSEVGPRLVELRYRPADARRHVALVGKGITFDSGGLSLKASQPMESMKVDMAGAATVLATVKAAASLRLPVAVTGLLALAENMPSGTATRPGDVLTIRGGTTVEVLNTDAEGRLVLADALVHAGELDPAPDVILDAATLTGAASKALGRRIGVLISPDDELARAVLDAAERSGERFWRLPLATEEYGEDLKGDVGDIKNSGWDDAGTIRAALFLHRFVPDGTPWVHLDIAGVAWAEEERHELSKGGTGVPARTLVEWLRQV